MIDAAGAREGTSLADLVERYPHRAGVPKLSGLLANPRPMTRSDLEAKLFDAMACAGLPPPQVNAAIEGYEVDFAWQEHGVIAELDTYVTHGSPLAFELDRARDRRLTAAGWRVVRLTDWEIETALEDLSRLLAASAASSPSRRAAA